MLKTTWLGRWVLWVKSFVTSTQTVHVAVREHTTLSDIMHESVETTVSKGFNPRPAVGDLCSLLHEEVSELYDAHRKGKLDKQCDKSVAMTCAEEEVADILLRGLGTAYALGVDPDEAVKKKLAYNKTRPYLHGGKRV